MTAPMLPTPPIWPCARWCGWAAAAAAVGEGPAPKPPPLEPRRFRGPAPEGEGSAPKPGGPAAVPERGPRRLPGGEEMLGRPEGVAGGRTAGEWESVGRRSGCVLDTVAKLSLLQLIVAEIGAGSCFHYTTFVGKAWCLL